MADSGQAVRVENLEKSDNSGSGNSNGKRETRLWRHGKLPRTDDQAIVRSSGSGDR
jgi:hypothetical protein